ncbi:hypothetical protein protein, putative [Babesia ovis]|uniref:CS domain-containing protein n=1 Tax=Babesia ovis TaxID=5869 RepID=A0A9W5TC48_BABOV|nr:hypothetical protein protein, putative [Babesia ovis]
MHAAARGFSNIEQLLDAFFGFLCTQTDFYHTQLSQSDIQRYGLDGSVNSRGFKEGYVRQLIIHIYEKNLEMYRQRYQPYLLGPSGNKLEATGNRKDKKVHVVDNKHPIDTVGNTSASIGAMSNSIPENPTQSSRIEDILGTGTQPSGDEKDNQHMKIDTYTMDRNEQLPIVEGVDQQVAALLSQRYTLNTWNGGATNIYCWSQTFTDVTIEIVAKDPLHSKQVKLDITRNSMQLSLWGKILIKGKLPHLINADESMWSIEDKTRLVISLEKSEERWWDNIIEGHPKIDVTQIESVKRFDEFSAPQQHEMIKLMKQHKEQESKGGPMDMQPPL